MSHGAVAIYGGVPNDQRQHIAGRFQHDPETRVLIANPAAAGTGFTLTAASYTIYESLSWRFDHYAQSQDRNHRIGQTVPVTYMRLIAADTIDEAIARALERKAGLARSLLSDGDAQLLLSRLEVQEWERFATGKGVPGSDPNEWGKLETLTHGTHLRRAVRIAEDGALNGALIYDGKLRQTRTEVIYFSPNTWGDGSRYGSFEFAVSWETLLRGRRLYWVESINAYQIPIYRFLLAKPGSALPVTPYDAANDQGPIRFLNGEWHWARGYVAEVVVDEQIALMDVSTINFERHHDRYCSLGSGPNCAEAGYGRSWRSHAAFMGYLLGAGASSLNSLLKDGNALTPAAYSALTNLYLPIVNKPAFGGPVNHDLAALDLMRSACRALYFGDREEVARLVGLLDTKERAEDALLQLIRAVFEIPSFEWI